MGPAALAGMLAGAMAVGATMALFMANAGGAWDNAKKYEKGGMPGRGLRRRKAAVVGDTIGDPFKTHLVLVLPFDQGDVGRVLNDRAADRDDGLICASANVLKYIIGVVGVLAVLFVFRKCQLYFFTKRRRRNLQSRACHSTNHDSR